jgi:hypothetical protein
MVRESIPIDRLSCNIELPQRHIKAASLADKGGMERTKAEDWEPIISLKKTNFRITTAST